MLIEQLHSSVLIKESYPQKIRGSRITFIRNEFRYQIFHEANFWTSSNFLIPRNEFHMSQN